MWLDKSSKLEYTAVTQQDLVKIVASTAPIFNNPVSSNTTSSHRMKLSIKGQLFDAKGELVFLDRTFHEVDLTNFPEYTKRHTCLILNVKDVDGKTEKLHCENGLEGYDLTHVLIEIA